MRFLQYLFFVVLSTFQISLLAQVGASDTIKNGENQIVIHPVYHGSLVLEIGQNKVFVDPYNGAKRYTKYGSADLVLITHQHGDHFDANTLKGLDLLDALFIIPEVIADDLDKLANFKKKILKNGESTSFNDFSIEAIPMYNLPVEDNKFHIKGVGNGYLIDYYGIRVYIAGDTEDIPEMRALKDVDVAFICMNLPYTMTIDQAADAVLEFKPKNVYPYHYRGKGGMSDVKKFKEIVESADSNINVKLRNWYPE